MQQRPVPPFIGRYRVDAVLGEGAMGVVYRAYDPSIDRRVALKVVHSDLLRGHDAASFAARFRREAQAAGRCHHPNIVAVYDFAEHEGQPFIAMEYVEGRALREAFNDGTRFQVNETIGIVAQVLKALSCAHDVGIVHRDIKPANVILLGSGVVKVADFGVSRIENSELTHDGTVIGSPSYMSPEQCHGETVDARTDLFSTGAVLFELLTGERAFPGNGYTQVLTRLLSYRREDLVARLAGVPEPLVRVTLTALERDRENRYPSAAAMADALRSAAAAVGAPDEGTVLMRPMPPRRADPAPGSAWAPSGVTPAAQPPLSGRESDTPTGSGSGSRSGSGSGTGYATHPGISAATLTGIERALAHHLGPIAKVMVKREMKSAQTAAELCERLLAHLDKPGEKAEFRTAVRSLL